jgi:hypothetical protein
MWERRGAYRVLMGKPEGRRLFGRLRCRWLENIKMYLDWIDLAHDRERWRALVNAVINLWIP